ncbi:MAG: TetR/AcrR family transcriptional regulator, partial [Thaumarchaeota archaeon]|nr:TetR/AcrR family transcriptional regulator [Nitrososphaerota archaeon]
MQTASEKASPERILRVAGRLFAERGFANVSVRDVCREAGTTAPMIYYYFGNKRGLFDAVVNRRISVEAFIERLKTSTKGRDGRQAVTSFVETYFTSFPENAFDPGL